MVTRYDLKIYLQGATQPVTTASLGKPAFDADGKIRVDFSTILIGWPLADGNYEARVAAIGPSGSGLSDVSNLFAFQAAVVPPPCTFALSATTGTAGASATTCAWTASTATTWITLNTIAGTGSGPVSFTMASNATAAARTGTLTAGGKVVTVIQAAELPPARPTGVQVIVK
jgi:hypothetical protein